MTLRGGRHGASGDFAPSVVRTRVRGCVDRSLRWPGPVLRFPADRVVVDDDPSAGPVHLPHRRGPGSSRAHRDGRVRDEHVAASYRLGSHGRGHEAGVVCPCLRSNALPVRLGPVYAVDAAVVMGARPTHASAPLCDHVGRRGCRSFALAVVGLPLGVRGSAAGGWTTGTSGTLWRDDRRDSRRHLPRGSDPTHVRLP